MLKLKQEKQILNNSNMNTQKLWIVILLLCFSSTSFSILPEKKYKYKPNHIGIPYQENDIKTKDGAIIKSWFLPCEYDYKKYNTIILCTGDAGNMHYLISTARMFRLEFNVILFDWRGFGESSYFPINTDYLTYKEFINDIEAVVDFYKTKPNVGKIGAWGHSAGGFLAIAGAKRNPKLDCIVVSGIPTNFEAFTREYAKVKPKEKKCIIPNDYPNEYVPELAAKSLKCPTYILVGENDIRCNPQMAKSIYKNIGSKVKKIDVEKGKGHSLLYEKIDGKYQFNKKYWNKVKSFFRDNLL
jgi:pimeloyl-ACP methyl ester carboxylesterase